MKVTHLIRNQSYEESEVWCDADYSSVYPERVSRAAEVTCHSCLLEAARYGDLAFSRHMVLLGRLPHLTTCGTAFRGCDPECPRGKAEGGRT